MQTGDERLWICQIEFNAGTEEEARSNQPDLRASGSEAVAVMVGHL